ncbi:putative hydrolase [Oxobacter pfennigii]|uniref:Putative hydrolase n=1 Tax=Oxobacter pfennigii TaxID=36849 RepID=A0A0P8Y9V0_9CLOT|nr:PHP domain-containing protein [Oxobacter pfennigii]KPU43691.1 putative hydrolase [Oxobacter pfennigii]
MGVINVDMHIHTIDSKDSLCSYESILKVCKKRNIDCIAICDHDSIRGAQIISNMNTEIKIIIGEEINTAQGEIIGLFLKQWIEPNMDVFNTIKKIREQNGIVYIPHPFDRLRKKRLKPDVLYDVCELSDIIEVFNSRNVYNEDNIKAFEFAQSKEILKGLGSDAHTPFEIGNSYIKMQDFNSPEEFLTSLSNAQYITKKSPLFVHFITKIVKHYNRWRTR